MQFYGLIRTSRTEVFIEVVEVNNVVARGAGGSMLPCLSCQFVPRMLCECAETM